ncbi:MAG TPA: hypothetical protein VGJ83_02860 [Gemmatimonadales bacterium]
MTPRRRLARLALVLALAACTDKLVAPGACPDFCPSGTIVTADTILTDVIARDSSFRGYLRGDRGSALAVADLPGVVDSRAIMLMNKMNTRVAPKPPDTATVPISVDSSWLRVHIVRRDTNTANLWLKLYRLPLTIDSTITFAALAPAFADSLIDSVNVDSLLARPLIEDTATVRIWGDTIRTDSAGHVLQVADADSSLILYFLLDTLQAPFSVADSGQLAFGVRVAADSLASISLGSNDVLNRDAVLRRFYHYVKTIDSTTDSTIYATADREVLFDGFVFDPPNPALDSNLTVGGVPSARSLVRVAFPSFLRDSTDIVRATLILVPVGPALGAAGDSFAVLARPVIADLGGKSPLRTEPEVFGITTIHLNTADTVRIEVTDMLRLWSADTAAATALMLSQAPEAATYTQARFYSSRTPAFRPALRITYVKRYPFGVP